MSFFLNETHEQLCRVCNDKELAHRAEASPQSKEARVFRQLCYFADEIDHARKWDRLEAFNLLFYYVKDLLNELPEQRF